MPVSVRYRLTDAEVVEALNARLPPALRVQDLRSGKTNQVHVGLVWPWPEGVGCAPDLHALANRVADTAAAMRAALAEVVADARLSA